MESSKFEINLSIGSIDVFPVLPNILGLNHSPGLIPGTVQVGLLKDEDIVDGTDEEGKLEGGEFDEIGNHCPGVTLGEVQDDEGGLYDGDDGKYVEEGLLDGEGGLLEGDGKFDVTGEDGVKEEEKPDDLYTKGPPLSP